MQDEKRVKVESSSLNTIFLEDRRVDLSLLRAKRTRNDVPIFLLCVAVKRKMILFYMLHSHQSLVSIMALTMQTIRIYSMQDDETMPFFLDNVCFEAYRSVINLSS